MKITDIKTFTVDCFRTNWVFVKVYTDEGITGIGEATLEYKEKARTKEEYASLAERLLVDDSDKWDSYKTYVSFSELTKGKKYIFFHYDGWGQLMETEQIKKGIASVVDAIVEQFGNK